MDWSCPEAIERVLPNLPGPEKTAALAASPLDLDFQFLSDRTSIIWTATGYHDMMDQHGRNVSSHPGQYFTFSGFETLSGQGGGHPNVIAAEIL